MAVPTAEDDHNEVTKYKNQRRRTVPVIDITTEELLQIVERTKRKEITELGFLNLNNHDKTEVVTNRKDVTNSNIEVYNCNYSDLDKNKTQFTDETKSQTTRCLDSLRYSHDGNFSDETLSIVEIENINTGMKTSGFMVVITLMVCIVAYFKTWTHKYLKNSDVDRSKYYFNNHNTKMKDLNNGKRLIKDRNWFQNVFKTFQLFPRTELQIFILNSSEYNDYIDKQKHFTSSLKDAMQFEWSRLSSFANYPQNGLSVIRLTEAGFHYQGNGDEVVCYFCGTKHKNWQTKDNPKTIHSQYSPNCPFVLKNIKPSDNGLSSANQPNKACVQTESSTGACANQSVSAGACGHQSESIVTPGIDNKSNDPVKNEERKNLVDEVSERYKNSQNEQIIAHTAGAPERSSHSSQGRQTIDFSTFSTNNTTGLIRITENPNQCFRSTPTTSTNNQHNHSSPASNLTREPSSSSAAYLEPMSMGVCTEKPKYPKYAVRATRLSSYTNWPSYLEQTPEELSFAGFFHTGTEDHCRCFFCGGGLRRWEAGDLPWTEHARWYPKCPFVRQNKGEKFIQDVKEGKNPERNNTNDNTRTERTNLNGYSNNPAVQSVLEFGIESEMIKTAYHSLAESGVKDITASLLLEKIYEIEDRESEIKSPENAKKDKVTLENKQKEGGASNVDPELELSIASLEEENRNLKDQQTCKICLDEPIGIVFLPCGHMACCVNCAPALRRCPICRTFIKGTVKAIMC